MSDIIESDVEVTKESQVEKQIESDFKKHGKQRANKVFGIDHDRISSKAVQKKSDLDLNDLKSQYGLKQSKEKAKEASKPKLNKSSLGPGLILKTMREEAGLTKDDVAKELRLAVRHIEHLENDQYEKFSALVFYIGNLRHYSNLLELDAEKMIAKFYAVYNVNVDNTTFKVVPVDTWQEIWPMKFFLGKDKTQEEKSQNIKVFTSAVLGLVIFCLVWWMLSSGSKTSLTESQKAVATEKVLDLKPEQVDELLPTSPVIVKNDDSNKKKITKSALPEETQVTKKFSKRSKLDDLS